MKEEDGSGNVRLERRVRRGIQEEDIPAEDMETAYLIIDLVKERDLYMAALEKIAGLNDIMADQAMGIASKALMDA